MEILGKKLYLTEGLIHSYSVQTTVRSLSQRYKFFVFKGDIDDKYFFLKFKNSDYGLLKNFIQDCNNLYGWYPTSIDYNKIDHDIYTREELRKEVQFLIFDGFEKFTPERLKEYVNENSIICIQFEPKHDVRVSNIPIYLYHVTDAKNVENILRIGLIPKTKNLLFNYPDRVYLSLNLKGAEVLSEQFFELDKEPQKILKIDTTKLNKIELFRDPNFPVGVYSLNNISKEAITIEK